ncbi:MAG: putative motility protein [Planctomycetaceae bacterium]|nr:putative motility protein [Planctomycetaceae bacterium]
MSSCSACSSVMAAQSEALSHQINFAVLKKAQDATKVQGEAAVQMLQAAAAVGKAIGKGNHFDALA